MNNIHKCLRQVSVLVSIGAFVFITLAGCSVKEDRDLCPALLVLDIDNVGEYAGKLPEGNTDKDDNKEGSTDISGKVHTYLSSRTYGFLSDTISIADLPGTVSRVVKRQKGFCIDVVYSGLSGPDIRIPEFDNGIDIMKGQDCPPLWMYSEVTDITEDLVRRQVHLSKNYCGLTIKIRSYNSEDDKSLGYAITGNYSGYMPGGGLREGEFSYVPKETGPGVYKAGLPRQGDSSLMLQVISGGKVLRTFSLGEYIIESGYDWNAKDLKDIEVEINYAPTEIGFIIDEWKKEVAYEVII